MKRYERSPFPKMEVVGIKNGYYFRFASEHFGNVIDFDVKFEGDEAVIETVWNINEYYIGSEKQEYYFNLAKRTALMLEE
jgi:hypothetical protein